MTRLNDNVAADRMEKRIDRLEEEMKRSERIGRKMADLKAIQLNLKNQPAGRKLTDDQPEKRKQFNRQRIETEDLVNENVGIYKSTWAKQVDEQLRAATRLDGEKTREKHREAERGEKEKEGVKDREEVWEILHPAMEKNKIRKPIVEPVNWFGDEESTGTDTSTGDSDWTDIDRARHSKENKKKRKQKKKTKNRGDTDEGQEYAGSRSHNK